MGPGNFLWHKEQVKAEELESSYPQTAGLSAPTPPAPGGKHPSPASLGPQFQTLFVKDAFLKEESNLVTAA